MTTGSSITPAWGPARWRGTVGLLFLLQLALLFLFGAKKMPPARLSERSTQLKIVPGARQERELAVFLTVEDPTLFALPGPYGFTGPAWLHTPAFEYKLTNWTESPHWLELELSSLAETVKLDGPTASEMLRPIHDQLEPPLARPELLGPKPIYKSELRLEGELASRGLESTVQLPAQRHSDVLNPTVIQAGIDPDGRVLSANVWSKSGAPEADATALKIAKGLLFRPIPPNERTGGTLSWGRLIFRWFTEEPPQK
jgi:TonB family protein